MLIYSFIFKSQSSKDQNEYKNRYIKILAEIYLLSYNFWPNEARQYDRIELISFVFNINFNYLFIT